MSKCSASLIREGQTETRANTSHPSERRPSNSSVSAGEDVENVLQPQVSTGGGVRKRTGEVRMRLHPHAHAHTVRRQERNVAVNNMDGSKEKEKHCIISRICRL